MTGVRAENRRYTASAVPDCSPCAPNQLQTLSDRVGFALSPLGGRKPKLTATLQSVGGARTTIASALSLFVSMHCESIKAKRPAKPASFAV